MGRTEQNERDTKQAARRIMQRTGLITAHRGQGWRRLRELVLREIDAAYSRGYSAGHEDQMQMRETETKPLSPEEWCPDCRGTGWDGSRARHPGREHPGIRRAGEVGEVSLLIAMFCAFVLGPAIGFALACLFLRRSK